MRQTPPADPGSTGADCTASDSTASDYPVRSAASARLVSDLDAAVTECRACPRLVAWRETVAAAKRKSFQEWEYWGRPVPGFGPADAPMAVIGLAPAAHGGNRTGRAFTGDASGDVLYAALHAIGLATQPTATRLGDGLELLGVRISMPVHCAPPDNKPTVEERDTCLPWLERELDLMRPTLRAVVALGLFAWQALLPVLAAAGWEIPRPRPKFGHGAQVALKDSGAGRVLHLLGCYHPSQRNVFTGTLTRAMLEDVLRRAAEFGGLRDPAC